VSEGQLRGWKGTNRKPNTISSRYLGNWTFCTSTKGHLSFISSDDRGRRLGCVAGPPWLWPVFAHSWLIFRYKLQPSENWRIIAVASLRPPTMHIRLSDRHAGKAAEAPVVPRPGLFRFSIWRAARLDRFSGDNRDCFASRHDGDIDRRDTFLISDGPALECCLGSRYQRAQGDANPSPTSCASLVGRLSCDVLIIRWRAGFD